MSDLKCIRFNPKLDEYLKKLAHESGMKLLLEDWEKVQGNVSGALVVTLDQDHLEDCHQLLKRRQSKTVVALNARRDFKLVNELREHLPQIFGFLDLSQETNYNVPLVKNYINMHFNQTVELDKLATDLDKVYEYTKSELTRVKDLHDRLVKVRVDNLKGVTITSKFMAGEKSGGEFFDMVQTDQHVLFIMAGSNNYVVSSLILAEMEVLKMSTPTTLLKSQCEHFEKMINLHAAENSAQINYCLINIDLKNLQSECIFKGEGNLYFNDEICDFSQPLKLKMKPGQKIHLLSQGAVKNLQELNQKLKVKDFYLNHKEKNTKDLINEFFFEVSRNKAGNFLNYDAIMAVIEIDSKALYQI